MPGTPVSNGIGVSATVDGVVGEANSGNTELKRILVERDSQRGISAQRVATIPIICEGRKVNDNF